MLKTFVASTIHTQVILQSIEASLKNLESIMGQISTSLHNLEVENIGELPTDLESKLIENDSTLSLQSGKQLDMPPHTDTTFDQISTKEVQNSTSEASSPLEIETFTLTKFKNEEENKVIIKINISLLTTIKQVPPYAKLPKELSINKRKLKGGKKISMGENVSTILQRKLLPKHQDLGMFINAYTIVKTRFDHCMIDVGASINVMSYFIFATLNIGLLKETGVIIQLTDYTNVYPLRVVEDVLVQVQFRRPFLLNTSTKLDVKAWVLTMKFDGEVIQFDMLNSIDKYKRKKVLLNGPP
ncbi:uncharacterized protein LOC133832473 [Humulus lupulus]|uniref:uncharacterized protein LOC133832473 n=1 Tax=Humulus lupulus TaxID=3486 RepID=UPI002B417385|nr:uncharacterized protein LOC133832473 [Humulus lupulus]